MIKTADVIVIGSGVIGCAAAYYMAKKGMSVLVLDQDESVGTGSPDVTRENCRLPFMV